MWQITTIRATGRQCPLFWVDFSWLVNSCEKFASLDYWVAVVQILSGRHKSILSLSLYLSIILSFFLSLPDSFSLSRFLSCSLFFSSFFLFFSPLFSFYIFLFISTPTLRFSFFLFSVSLFFLPFLWFKIFFLKHSKRITPNPPHT